MDVIRRSSPFPRTARWAIGILAMSVPAAAVGTGIGTGDGDCSGTRVVESGDTVWGIARECGLSVRAILRANDLEEGTGLRPGQRLRIPAPRNAGSSGSGGSDQRVPDPPSGNDASAEGDGTAAGSGEDEGGDEDDPRVTSEGVVLELASGQTLSDIAEAYGVTVERLCEANDIEDANRVRAGQRIVVPGATEVVEVRGGTGASRPRHSSVTFHRIDGGEEITVRLFDNRDRFRRGVQDEVDHILRHVPTGREIHVSTDLLRLVQAVADHWPGRRLMVQSCVRPLRQRPGREPGNHMVGRAMDFSVEGVSHEALRDFCRTFSNAGVGYYPNSTFIHLDYRDRPTYWVDLSGPGEPARYVDPDEYHRSHRNAGGAEPPPTPEPDPVPAPPGEDGGAGPPEDEEGTTPGEEAPEPGNPGEAEPPEEAPAEPAAGDEAAEPEAGEAP